MKVKEIMSQVFGVDVGSINDDTKNSDIETWDSFNALLLVSELEKEFDVKFETEEIMELNSYSEIISLLKNHGVSDA